MDRLTAIVNEHWEFFHAHPEMGHEEYMTAAYIAEELRKYGYQVIENVGTTGVIGVWDSGVPGISFALRADMDALRFIIDGEENIYHGCCHDAHCAILLTAAKLIKEQDIVKKGKLTLLFQPAEEPADGAYAVIESGALSGIDEMVGLHLRNKDDGEVGSLSAALISQGLGVLTVTMRGKVSHASQPHKGINAIEAAVLSINAVNSLRFDPLISHSIKVTRFWADATGENTIPGIADFSFDLRSEDNHLLAEMKEAAEKAVRCCAETVGASCEFKYVMNPAAEPDPELTEYCRQCIVEETGYAMPDMQTPGADDFHCYSQIGIKTAYMGLAGEVDPRIHVYGCTFNKDCLPIGVKVFMRIVKGKLG